MIIKKLATSLYVSCQPFYLLSAQSNVAAAFHRVDLDTTVGSPVVPDYFDRNAAGFTSGEVHCEASVVDEGCNRSSSGGNLDGGRSEGNVLPIDRNVERFRRSCGKETVGVDIGSDRDVHGVCSTHDCGPVRMDVQCGAGIRTEGTASDGGTGRNQRRRRVSPAVFRVAIVAGRDRDEFLCGEHSAACTGHRGRSGGRCSLSG